MEIDDNPARPSDPGRVRFANLEATVSYQPFGPGFILGKLLAHCRLLHDPLESGTLARSVIRTTYDEGNPARWIEREFRVSEESAGALMSRLVPLVYPERALELRGDGETAPGRTEVGIRGVVLLPGVQVKVGLDVSFWSKCYGADAPAWHAFSSELSRLFGLGDHLP